MSDEYDYKYDSLEDPHVYPGTRILRNKFGIKHQDLLSELESQTQTLSLLNRSKVTTIFLLGILILSTFKLSISIFLASFTIGLVRFVNKGSSVRGSPSSALLL